MEPCKIIIVEDDIIIQMFLEKILSGVNCEIIGIFNNSDELLKEIEKYRNRVDVFLLDIGLPGKMDGVELAEKIKNKFNVHIVFVTGNTDEPTFKRAQKVNPLRILGKPLEEGVLKREFEMLFKKIKS